MSTHVAFLRGMNVGGHRLTNEELRAHFTSLGFREVATFRASGNVVFAGGEEAHEDLRERIEQGLQASLGYAVPAFVRAREEVRAISSMQPFTAERVDESGGKLQVALLGQEPTTGAAAQALALSSDRDALALEGRELYWLPSGGLLESGLDMKLIARTLGPFTVRTKATIELIAARHFST